MAGEIARRIVEEGDLPTALEKQVVEEGSVALPNSIKVHFVESSQPGQGSNVSLCGLRLPPFYIDYRTISEFKINPYQKLTCESCISKYRKQHG